MRIPVDRTLGVSIRQQIRGAIADGIAFGALGPGSPLPSVRDLAERAGVAPVTVSKIYAELQAGGLIEGRSGSGTFVADSPLARAARTPGIRELRDRIDGMVELARSLGVTPADVAALVNLRAGRLAAVETPRIAMVGLFDDATRSYAACVAAQVGPLAQVEAATLHALETDGAVGDRVRGAGLILTFADLQARVEAVAGGVRTISLRFIPAEATRMALAALDPLDRVALVSRFAEFAPILTLGFRRFAAHVQTFEVLPMEDAAGLLDDRDVLVLSTGADAAARHAAPGTRIIEYRHIPDPGDIDRLVLPLLGEVTQRRKEAS